MKKIDRNFYNRDTATVAKELLGKYLVHRVDGEDYIGKIVETEAYLGADDKAAHSYNMRRTERNKVMFGSPGFAYVYFIYGMYYCFNVVTREEEVPQAVLIRALQPISSLDKMAINRYRDKFDKNKVLKDKEIKNLTNGPGKLCNAMKIDKSLNGIDLCADELFIVEGVDSKYEGYKNDETFEIISSKRINIDYSEEAADFLLRFYIKNNKFISVKDKG